MLDGKANKYHSGGNVQREKFGSGLKGGDEPKGEKAKPEPKTEGDEGEAKTEITHHADGSHTAVHPDGETSEHPSMGHLAMHLHAKHETGSAVHAHEHEGGVTTHHVGADGMVEGPTEHGSSDEAGEHMKQVLCQDGGNGAVDMSDGEMPAHAMPTLY